MNGHFWKSKILVAIVIGLFSLMVFTEVEKAAPSTQLKNAESLSQPTVREREGTAPQVLQKKKFPWLLVVAVTLVAGAAVYYFVVLNKKYTMTTNVGTGVDGTPATGSVKYKKGSVINYGYTPASGYTSLVVTLDGIPVAASGTVTMDKDHTLSATAVQQHALTVITYWLAGSGYPSAGTYYFEKGSIVNYWYSSISHEVQVKLDGVKICDHGTVSDTYDVPCSGSFVMNDNHTLEVISY
ncbi:MAG: hypothetical protein NTZ12_07770 [Candidatus Aminicenantes bacterium]|nr:hypothetical protein [Candidatus Aminicenantes bacterium]